VYTEVDASATPGLTPMPTPGAKMRKMSLSANAFGLDSEGSNGQPPFRFPILSMQSFSGGFMVGSSQGTIFFYAYDESKDQVLFDAQFSLINSLSISSDMTTGGLLSLALCPKDEKLCLLTSDGQILFTSAVYKESLKPDQVKYAVSSFHGPKSITGMDVAIRKPLILTCSKDNTLRLWNIKSHQLDLLKVYPEEMFSVALHPTGARYTACGL
jgi:WD40 repeat protein